MTHPPDDGIDPADPGDSAHLDELLSRIPVGWTRGAVDGRPWAVSRTVRVGGRSESLWAEPLDGGEAFGANVWHTGSGTILRPCEVPAELVVEVLGGWRPVSDGTPRS